MHRPMARRPGMPAWRAVALAAVALAAAALFAAAPACAEAPVPRALYTASVIVTGTDMRERPDGLAECLRRVLVKLSGNPALAADPRVAPIAARAAQMVDDLVYLDRMSDVPRGDEQGSRDRPQDLVAHFDPARIDAALAGLGERPWIAPRPTLIARIAVRGRNATEDVPLTADNEEDERLRRAMLDAAARYGMVVVLPMASPADAPQTGISPDMVSLSGKLVWSDRAFGWVGRWQLRWRGRDYGWGISGVSFDDAFRDAVSGAMQILSGHGAPR